jgi:glutaminyl-peptide cyclotransferase
MKLLKNTFFLMLIALFIACGGEESSSDDVQTTTPSDEAIKIPVFSKDTAYNYVAKQVSFGPRVPNTKAHKDCAAWMISEFKSMGLTVVEQDFVAKTYTGANYQSKNIIASINPSAKNRMLLCAHWDSRHIADQDADPARRNQAILGADDGGSGVAVLMEIGRLIGKDTLNIGVDLILFDSEDNGATSGDSESWCLGSQYWGKNLHVTGYKARFGILLDMVGSKSPVFPMEATSMKYAPQLMTKVWDLAHNMGMGMYFNKTQVGGVTDDHLYVNTLAGIPTIDIINLQGSDNAVFGPHWHTHNDNMDVISANTLGAVGQLMLKIIYMENAQQFNF